MSDGAKESVTIRREQLELADKLDLIFDRIGVSCDWRLSSEERQDVARAANALRATPPAAPAGGESKEARSARRRGHTCSSQYVMRELPDPDCAACNAAPAQSIGDEGEREAAIERIMSIRNGMTPDVEARAIVRRELAALGAPAQSNGDEGECTSPACERDIKALMEQCGDQFSEITALRDQLAKARAALELARVELKSHDQDYQHRTAASTYAEIDEAMDAQS